jgi:Uma2 family endonuclease
MAGSKLTDAELDRLIYDGAVKLEITGGIPTWEVSPSVRHQRMVYLIQTSIRLLPGGNEGCACAHLADIYIRFPDGSIKRPDIAIFCEEPPDQDEALTTIPRAVIEIISPGYEYKDVELNPRFYLSQGVEDVVTVDPRSGVVTHYRAAGVSTYQAPVTVSMLCGCECTVP